MTVQVGRKNIILGWEVAIAIVIAVIGAGYGFGSTVKGFLVKQDEILSYVKDGKQRDSVTNSKIDYLLTQHAQDTPKLRTMQQDIGFIMKKFGVVHTSIGYVTEHRDKNGHITIEKAKNN